MKKLLLLFGALLVWIFGFGQDISIGAHTSGDGGFPAGSFEQFSYAQTIYTKAELDGVNPSLGGLAISQLTFTYRGAANGGAFTLWDIYIGHTSKSTFTSTTDWVAVGDMQLVFSGDANVPDAACGTSPWCPFTVTLTTEFVWNGDDNIVIAVNEKSTGVNTAASWSCHTASNKSLVRGNHAIIDPSSPGTATTLYRDNRPALTFFFGVPLPIELNSFSATCQGGQAHLNWSTITEQNNHYFTVEKSEDGINWEVLDTLLGAGMSVEELFYTLNDEYSYRGVSYYRLKQTDFDGKFKYFDPVSVNCELDIVVSPNPSDGLYSINGVTREMKYVVYDAIGKIVLNGDFNEVMTVDISHLSGAMYFLQIEDGSQFHSFRLFKM